MYIKNKHNLLLLFFLFLLLSAFRLERPVTIFMIGDSTMATKNLEGGNPERGWGHMLPGFFSGALKIENHAQNGRSSKSFIDEGRWEKVINRINPGDYLFIQFGHNDSKPDSARYTSPYSSYTENLTRFVHECKSKGGIPVLFTSIVRRHFDENDVLTDTHGDYLDAARQVARETGTVLIDLNKSSHELVQQLGPETSKELFVWIDKGTVACCPEGKQDDTHLNVKGARQIAGLAVKELSTHFPQLAAAVNPADFVVAQDGSGDFFTVQEAIQAVPDYRKEARTRILIRKGTYKEKVVVSESKINVSLIGEDGVVIIYDDYAGKLNTFGETKTTSGSATFYMYAPGFVAENITFQNNAGPVGQAVAILVKGDRAVFRNCRFLGFQDTLYTYGTGRQYYEDCYIEGSVDFIFGGATAFFNRCTIHSKLNGYLTAPSTPQGKSYGYVFQGCKLTASLDVDSVYLSRPWRPYAQAVFIHCHMDKHILPEGWHNWNKPEAEKTVFYGEYQNTGAGANPRNRVAFSSQLKTDTNYTIQKVLSGNDSWNPLVDEPVVVREN